MELIKSKQEVWLRWGFMKGEKWSRNTPTLEKVVLST